MIRHESVITALIGGALGIVLGIVLGALLIARVDFIEFALPDDADHRLRDRRDRRRHPRRDLPGPARGEARSAQGAPVRVASARAASRSATSARATGSRTSRRRSRLTSAPSWSAASLPRGLPRDRGGQLRQSTSACRRWPGAEEVVAAVGDVEAELSGLVLNERGWERLAADAARPCQRDALRPRRPSTSATATRRWRSARPASSGSSRSPTGRRRRRSASPSGCPFEGEGRPGVVADLAERLVAAGARRGRPRATRSASRRRRPVRAARRAGRRSSASLSAVTSTTRATPASPAPGRRSRRGRPCSTRRSAASAAARSRRARPATSPTEDVLYLLDREARRDGRRPRGADRRRAVARGAARAASYPAVSTEQAPSRPLTACYPASGTRTMPASARSAISSSS